MPRVLYPTSDRKRLDPAVFRNPPAEYRGAPFWAWNCSLERERLLEQLAVFKEMGLGGGHAHVRVGLATGYLGDEFMGHIRACVDEAKRLGLRLFLYDEDRWPSGAAGGLVTREPRFRQRELVLQPGAEPLPGPEGAGEPVVLARFAVRLAGDGSLASYRRIAAGAAVPKGHQPWVAFHRSTATSSWYNGQTYADTLSVPAIEAFVDSTHERYRAVVGDEFGKAVPSIFCDEPNYGWHHGRARADDGKQQTWAWTGDLAETFLAAHGFDLIPLLPELAWDGPESFRVRWAFFDHLAERFATAFAGTIGAWCAKHGILHTGHLLEEPHLSSVTRCVGDAMRSYPGFQIPGIDLLCDSVELTSALQARSVARQDGREGVMSELYGVTGWDFDFAGHKRQGDWQAALGITLRVHHLSWVSMAGEAKRDYPAAIDEHSPWWREYPLVEDHFARVNTALTRGQPLCRVAVVHPIESFWPLWGPADRNRDARASAERRFDEITRWLHHGLVDADFVCEGLLPKQGARVRGRRLQVGRMAYDAIVLPGLETVRGTTLALLRDFAAAGGTVIVLGQVPGRLDAEPSARPAKAAKAWTVLPWDQAALLGALAPLRDVDVVAADGMRPEGLLHQLRSDGDDRHLFLCNLHAERGTGVAMARVRGTWDVTCLDTLTGEQRPLPAEHRAGWTSFRADLAVAGSLLVRLAKARKAASVPVSWAAPAAGTRLALLADPVPVSLDEPNVLLLDQAEYALDDGPWEPADELLRIGNRLRQRIGLQPAGGAMVQPWVLPRPPAANRVRLRFRLDLAVPVSGARLALEHAADSAIAVDGRRVDAPASGWWVDHAIGTVALPDLPAGVRTIEVVQPLGAATALEWMYLLGDFGVELRGARARVVAPVRELGWGDWTTQGLPFYAGNVTYRCPITADGSALRLRAPRFRATLLGVALDQERVGRIAFQPYQLDLGRVAAGAHELAITAFGSRVNAFSCLHHAEHAKVRWLGPDAWRTDGDQWTWNWQVRPAGILAAPELVRLPS